MKPWLDLAERTGATFAEAFIAGLLAAGAGMFTLDAAHAAALAGVATGLAVLKTGLAQLIPTTVGGSLIPVSGPPPLDDVPAVAHSGPANPVGLLADGQSRHTTAMARLALLPAPSGRKLGRRPLTRDSRDLKLRTFADLSKVRPSSVHWGDKLTFGMLLNDRLGDCVPAGMLHQVQVWSAAAGNREFVPTDADALALYEEIAGYNPSDPSTDQGTDPRAALRWWKANGAAGHEIAAYVAVDPTNEAEVKTAVWLCGGIGLCLELPKAAQGEGVDWKVTRGKNAAPGSWGGHWTCANGYDRHGLIDVTWGEQGRLTWGFLERYCVGAYACVSPDWMSAAGVSPSGLNLAALTRAVASI